MDELIGMIDNYLLGKGRSLSSLARDSEVNYTTLKRIYSKEVTEPEFTNVLKLITFLSKPNQSIAFLNKYYPEQSACFTGIYKDYSVSDKILNDELKDPMGFLVIHMGFANSGTTRSAVIERLGRMGLEKLEELLNSNVLREINGRIKTKDFKCADANVVVEKVKMAAKYFNTTNLGDNKSLAAFICDGYSEWGLSQLYEAEKQKVERVAEIGRDPRAKGDHVAFNCTLFNRLPEGLK